MSDIRTEIYQGTINVFEYLKESMTKEEFMLGSCERGKYDKSKMGCLRWSSIWKEDPKETSR